MQDQVGCDHLATEYPELFAILNPVRYLIEWIMGFLVAGLLFHLKQERREQRSVRKQVFNMITVIVALISCMVMVEAWRAEAVFFFAYGYYVFDNLLNDSWKRAEAAAAAAAKAKKQQPTTKKLNEVVVKK